MSARSADKTPKNTRLPITVLISGSGTNLQALIDASSAAPPLLPHITIIRVISNRKDAYGLARAQRASLPTSYHNLVKYKKQHPDTPDGVQAARQAYDRDLAQMILDDQRGPPAIVVCAGWMHILSSIFIDMLTEKGVKIINLHPALPGQFTGAGAIHRAYEAFQRGEIDHTGIMIHHVIGLVDMGDPIVTRRIPLHKGEREEELETRIHEAEWDLIVEGTRRVVEEIRANRGKS